MPTKKELVQEFRVRAIREAARRVVSRQGVAGATVEAIAAEAGIAKGTIYLYFRNREDLLEQTVEDALAELLGEVESVFDSADGFELQLARFFRTTLGFFDEQRGFFRLVRAARHDLRAGPDRRPSAIDAEYHERIHGWLRRAMAAGQARGLDVERLALAITETLIAVVRRRDAEEPPPPVETDTEFLAALFLHGLHVPATPPTKRRAASAGR